MIKRLYTCLLVIILGLVSCQGSKQSSDTDKFLIGVMPSVDNLPLSLAISQGYFDSLGLDVQLVRFASPMERDAALQAGTLDATISDYTTVMIQNAQGLPIQLLSATDGLFDLIVTPQSGINLLSDLKHKRIGLSSNTVIEYATDMSLAEASLPESAVTKVEVQKIPLRLEMLAKGELDAAVLPQPFATIAQKRGLIVVPASVIRDVHISGLAIDTERTKGREATIVKLIEGYNKAVDYLNSNDRSEWIELVAKDLNTDVDVANAIPFGKFSPITSPDAQVIQSIANWLKSKVLIANDYDPTKVVMPLPQP